MYLSFPALLRLYYLLFCNSSIFAIVVIVFRFVVIVVFATADTVFVENREKFRNKNKQAIYYIYII